MDPKINPVEGVKKPSAAAENLKMQSKEALRISQVIIEEQVVSEESMLSYAELGSEFNPLTMGRNFKELSNQPKKETELASTALEQPEDEDPAQTLKIAEQASKKNPELLSKTLVMIRSTLKSGDTPEEMLSKIRKAYPDVSLADDVLDFLIESFSKNKTVAEKLNMAKSAFNAAFGREIKAGKNIQEAARAFSEQGLGDRSALKNLYRDVVGNPREAPALFEELSNHFPFPQMKMVIDFILHSLGQDMKSKGPSISKEELQRLFSETRTMQAILGVYRFFFSRMNLIQNAFKRGDMACPNTVNFQTLAKAFIAILKDRYPNAGKILGFASPLGISKETLAKIIVFTQMRDALRETAPKLYKSEQHRQDLLMTFIEMLSDLEDELDEEEEDEEEEEKK